jgi:hypothetical protein
MVTGLLLLAMFQIKKIGAVGEINVFLNFAIFFIISKLSIPSIFNEEISLNLIQSLHDWAFYILSAMISVTLVLRWKALMTRKMFFNGVDLTLIVFMMLTFIVNNILRFDLNYFLSISMLEAFIFYTWFKLVADFYTKYEYKLTLVSFMLSISLLSILILYGIF